MLLPASNGSRLQPAQHSFNLSPADPCHQIELARPGVARHDWIQPHAVAGKRHVALFQQLRHRIEAGHIQTHLVEGDRFGIDVLVVAQAVEEVGPPRLDDEGSIIAQVGGHILEAAHLVFLGQQVEQRVPQHIDQTVGARNRDTSEVADRDRHLFTTWLGAQLGDHRR